MNDPVAAGTDTASTTGAAERPAGGPRRPRSAKSAGPKASDIESISSLFMYAYAQQGKQVKVPQAVFKGLSAQRSAPDPVQSDTPKNDPAADLNTVRALAAADPLLTVPPRLLAAIEASNESKLLARQLLALVTAALRPHPIFRSDKAQAALDGVSPDVDAIFVSVSCTCADLTAADLSLAQKKFGPAERERLRSNAITSLALLLAARDEWSVRELVERLELHLWRHSARKPGNRPARVAVTEPPNLDSLAVVAQVFIAKVEEARQAGADSDQRALAAERLAALANGRALAADDRVQQHEVELAKRASQIAALEEQIRSLKTEVEEERRDRVIDQSHHLDDYTTLRTRVIRVLGKQIDLLEDGLHALRHGSSSITDEYIERSVHTLKKELGQLKQGGE